MNYATIKPVDIANGPGGDMITGWLFWNERWYYLKPDGIMTADEMTLNVWLLLSQHPSCLRNPTSFST